jgi:hypothetical protein
LTGGFWLNIGALESLPLPKASIKASVNHRQVSGILPVHIPNSKFQTMGMEKTGQTRMSLIIKSWNLAIIRQNIFLKEWRRKGKERISNIEYRTPNVEGWCAEGAVPFIVKIWREAPPSFDIRYSLFGVRYSFLVPACPGQVKHFIQS